MHQHLEKQISYYNFQYPTVLIIFISWLQKIHLIQKEAFSIVYPDYAKYWEKFSAYHRSLIILIIIR